MANKVRDYHKLAADIKDTIGAGNIMTATHCATRLRLVLKETPDDSVTKKIEQMSGVIQVVISGGQYQIVIGTHAKDVYEHLAGMVTFSGEAPQVKESLVNRVIAVMSGCIAPYVYVMAAAGLLQGILIIIKMFADVGNTGGAQIYNMISWTPFTFLPVFIAVAGAKHFKCNPYIALWCCMALANPSWGNIAASISEGTALNFLFVPLTSVTYTSTVIPPIILVAILSKLEHWVEPRLPEVVRPLGTPFICAGIMVPMTIIAIGPVSTVLSNNLASVYNKLYELIPWLASGLFGAIWEVLVIFGIHWSFTPISLTNYQNMGFDTLQAFKGIAVCAQVAACFGVFWKSRNSQVKNMAASSAATGLFGITEPAIYGITLRFKKPLSAAVSEVQSDVQSRLSLAPGILFMRVCQGFCPFRIPFIRKVQQKTARHWAMRAITRILLSVYWSIQLWLFSLLLYWCRYLALTILSRYRKRLRIPVKEKILPVR